jgi:uncharacterized protein (DUF4415 family)
MPKLKAGTIMPTDAEDNAIRAGIATDPDTFEPSDKDFLKLQPAKRGRPRMGVTKQAVKLRLDPEVISGFRARGQGSQASPHFR